MTRQAGIVIRIVRSVLTALAFLLLFAVGVPTAWLILNGLFLIICSLMAVVVFAGALYVIAHGSTVDEALEMLSAASNRSGR